eukprot:g83441.t1
MLHALRVSGSHLISIEQEVFTNRLTPVSMAGVTSSCFSILFACLQMHALSFPQTNCVFTTRHPDKPIMQSIKERAWNNEHPAMDTRLRPWLSNLASGLAHPSIDPMMRRGTGVARIPANHPDVDEICQIKMPATDYSWSHPKIEQNLIAKTLPASHPSVHNSLRHAMPKDHPDIDHLMADPSSWTYPSHHPDISVWVYRNPQPPTTPPSAECLSSFDPAALAQHSTRANCYVVFGRTVWDMSNYADKHPGGATLVDAQCGKNGTMAFNIAPHTIVPFANAGGHGVCKGTIAAGTDVGGGTVTAPPTSPPSAECLSAFNPSLLASHSTAADCFIVFGRTVWDLSGYAQTHPGGAASVEAQCGKNGTLAFNVVTSHSVVPFANVAGKGVCKGTIATGTDVGGGTVTAPPTSPPSAECLSAFDPSLLASHSTAADCFIVFGRTVWDLSGYAQTHPGGPASVEAQCGNNGTLAFNAVASHSVVPFANVAGKGVCKGTIAAGTDVGGGTPTGSGASAGGSPGAVGSQSFSDGPFSVMWTVEHDTQSILFTMSATTAGWVSLGISKHKSMTDMDCYTGFTSSGRRRQQQGVGVLVDAYSVNSVNVPLHDEDPALRGKSDVQLIESLEMDGRLTFTFRRLLSTGDVAGKDQDIGDFPLYLIWAVSDGSYETIHTRYGISAPINLLTGQSSVAWSAGIWLSMLVAAFLVLMGMLKYSYSCRKSLCQGASKSKKHSPTSSKAALNGSHGSSSSSVAQVRVLADVANIKTEARDFQLVRAGEDATKLAKTNVRSSYIGDPLSSYTGETRVSHAPPTRGKDLVEAVTDKEDTIYELTSAGGLGRGEWVQEWDATQGAIYWTNKRTGEKTWTIPHVSFPGRPHPPPPPPPPPPPMPPPPVLPSRRSPPPPRVPRDAPSPTPPSSLRPLPPPPPDVAVKPPLSPATLAARLLRSSPRGSRVQPYSRLGAVELEGQSDENEVVLGGLKTSSPRGLEVQPYSQLQSAARPLMLEASSVPIQEKSASGADTKHAVQIAILPAAPPAAQPTADVGVDAAARAATSVPRTSVPKRASLTGSGARGSVSMPPRPPPRVKAADTSAAAGGVGRNLALHQAMQLHQQHIGADLYEYQPEFATQPGQRLPMAASFVQNEAAKQDVEEEEEDFEYFGDDVLKEKKVSIWHSLRIVLTTTRIPHTQWSLGNLLFVLLYLGLNALALYLTPLRPLDYKNGLGSLAAANTMVLIVPATRNSILTWFLGLPFDHVILYHRLVGRVAMACVVAHAVLYRDALLANFTLRKYWTGFGAMLCGLVIFLTSLEWFRRHRFEIFYWSHFSFIGYFALAWMHVPQCKPFLAVGMALYALDKLLRALWTLIPHRTLVFAAKGEHITQVRFAKNPLTERLGKHKVGQYYFVNFPQLSLTEWHPFSVSSGPREADVELHIRALGDHTTKINKLARSLKPSPQSKLPWIRIDGPYGKLDFNIRRYNVLFLAGGGVGVTPVMGIMKELFNVGRGLSPSARATVKPHRIREVYVMWVIPQVADYEVFREDIEQCMLMARRPQFPKLRVMVYATRAKKEEAVPPIHTGRPNFTCIFDELERKHVKQAGLVFACGPEPMVNELWDQSSRRSMEGARLDFHHETFNF